MFSHLRKIKEVGTRFSYVRNHACGFHACVSHEMTRAAAALFGSRLSPHVARCSYSYTSALRPASLRQAARYGWVRAVRVPTPLHVGAFVLHTCRLRRPRPFLSTRFRAGAASSGANLCAWIRVAFAAVRPLARARRVARPLQALALLYALPLLAPCGSSRLSCLRLFVVRASLLCVEMSRVSRGSNVRHGVCGGAGA